MRSRSRWLWMGCLASAFLTLPYVLLVARLDPSRLGWQMFPVIALRAALLPVALVVGASGLERRSRLILIGVAALRGLGVVGVYTDTLCGSAP